MSDPPPRPPASASLTANEMKIERPDQNEMLCERCGAEMFRMHAVWRCPRCGFKTDCCGW
jgi:ribosomal protein L37E